MFKNLNPSALGITGHQSEIIELALTFGFGGLDLSVVDFATRVRLKGMPYARRLIDSARIQLGTFSLPTDVNADEETFQKELKKLPEYAQVAAEAGCTRCVAVLAPAGDKLPYHENFEFHRRRFQEICRALEPSGVRLAIGFLAAEYLRKNQAFQFIHDLDALTLLLNMIAAPNAGLLLDVWDVVASGGSLDTIRKLPAQQIVAVQVADMPAGVRLGVAFQAAEYLRKNQAFQFIHDLDALTLLVNMVNAPNLGVLVDTWDILACGATVDAIRGMPLKQIVAVQVADMPAEVPMAEMGENSRLLPAGESGRIDLTAVLGMLAKMGYNGPVTPKPSRGVFQSRRRDVIVKQVGEALERVWRAAGLPSEKKFVASAKS
jgi:sugar phosphate isomerase/epimerase